MQGGIPGSALPSAIYSPEALAMKGKGNSDGGFEGGFTAAATNIITMNVDFIDDVYPWIITITTAVAVGVIEFAPTAILDAALPAKLKFLDGVLEEFGLTALVFTNIGICLGCATLATAATVLMTPSAGGSGIPAILAYLTSDILQDEALFAPLTVLVKLLGICAVIIGGLVVGREVRMFLLLIVVSSVSSLCWCVSEHAFFLSIPSLSSIRRRVTRILTPPTATVSNFIICIFTTLVCNRDRPFTWAVALPTSRTASSTGSTSNGTARRCRSTGGASATIWS